MGGGGSFGISFSRNANANTLDMMDPGRTVLGMVFGMVLSTMRTTAPSSLGSSSIFHDGFRIVAEKWVHMGSDCHLTGTEDFVRTHSYMHANVFLCM